VSAVPQALTRAPAVLGALFVLWMAGILSLFYAVKEQKPIHEGDLALIGQSLQAFGQGPSLPGTLDTVVNLLSAVVIILFASLIGFRDSSAAVGLVQNNCPHRGASLFFGRNEETGLRCVYHGWKFDASGQCVDMPNEPAESDFKTKVSAVT